MVSEINPGIKTFRKFQVMTTQSTEEKRSSLRTFEQTCETLMFNRDWIKTSSG